MVYAIPTISEDFAHFLIGKGPIFSPKSGIGKSLYNSLVMVLVLISVPEDCFYLANSAGPDEMLHCAAFHLGIHCFPKYTLIGFSLYKGLRKQLMLM